MTRRDEEERRGGETRRRDEDEDDARATARVCLCVCSDLVVEGNDVDDVAKKENHSQIGKITDENPTPVEGGFGVPWREWNFPGFSEVDSSAK